MNSYYVLALAIMIPFLFLFLLQNKKIENFGFISSIRDKVAGWVDSNVVNPVKDASSSISNLPGNIGNKVLNSGGDFIKNIEKILMSVKDASSSISNLAVHIGNKVLDGGGNFINSVGDGVMSVKDKFLNIFTGFKEKLVNFIKRLKDGLSSFMNSKLESVRKFIGDRVNNIVNIKDFIFNKIKELWANLEKKIMQSLQYIFYGLLVLNGISLFGGSFNLIQYFFPRGCPNCSCQSC
jgi:phage-related protein